MKRLYVSLILILFFIPCMAQNPGFQPLSSLLHYCPEIEISSPNPLVLPCDPNNQCFDIEAKLPDIRQTVNGPDAYLVNEIDYNGNFGYNIPGAIPVLVDIDDRFSNVISLPFPFCFYGATYNQVVIGANGRISFDSSLSGQFDEWQITTNLPSNTGAHTRATIYGLYHDLDPSVSYSNKSIEYAIIDDAPCRKLVVTYRDIPHYDCNGLRSTFQIVLYENTNAIEVYVKGKPYCTSWQDGRTIIGVQNWDRNQAVTVPGHNFSQNQSIVEKAWRFIPNGPSLLAGPIELLDINNNLLQSSANPNSNNGTLEIEFDNVCLNPLQAVPQQFIVRAEYTACSGNNIITSDTVYVFKDDTTDDPTVTSPVEYCLNETANVLEAIADPNHTLNWYDENQNSLAAAPIPSTATPGTFTYYASQTFNNCESNLVPIEVTIYPEKNENVNENICISALPYTWNGQTWNNNTNPGTYTHSVSYSTIHGCDSNVTLNLEIIADIEQTENENICFSSLPFIWNNTTWDQNTAPGLYTETVTYTSASGCDSTVLLNLTINPVFNDSSSIAICSSDLPYSWNGFTWDNSTQAGIYNESVTYQTADGCDSTLFLELTINPFTEDTENITICSSDLPFTWNGYSWSNSTSAGVYNETAIYNTTLGCDSIINLILTINPEENTTEDITICSDELPFTWNGQTWGTNTTPGSYNHSINFSNQYQCDSIANLQLTITEIFETIEDVSICSDALPFSWHGQTWDENTPSGFYQSSVSYYSSSSCDSIIGINLTIYPEVKDTTIRFEDCEYIHFEGVDYFSSALIKDTLISEVGCDSLIRNIHIKIHPSPTLITNDINACDSVELNGLTFYESTTIMDTVRNTLGCDSIIYNANINIESLRLNLHSNLDSLIEGDRVYLHTTANLPYENYRWTPMEYFPNQSATNQAFIAKEAMDIWVYAESHSGCVDSANLKLSYEPLDVNIFMPNAFSPNGDGLNDDFGPTFNNKRGYEIEEFSIYNRYGQRVFYNTGRNKKWDGTFNGKHADVGTYFYILKVRFHNGETFSSQGDFHLIR